MTLMTLWGYVEIFMAHRESSGTGKKAWGGWFQFLSHQDGACFQAHRSPWSTFCRNPFVKMEHLSFFRDCFYCFQWIGCVICDELRRIASQHVIPRLSQMDLSMAQLSSFHGWLRQNSKPRLIRAHGACQKDNMQLTCLNLFDMSRIQIILNFILFELFWYVLITG